MHARTFGFISALLAVSAAAQTSPEPACSPCAVGARCVAGACQFVCTHDSDCRRENVCIDAGETAGHCEPRIPLRREGAPPTIRRGDATHAERFKINGPTPVGFHLAQEPSWETILRGTLAFASAWVPVAIVGLATGTPRMTIPLAGPILDLHADLGSFAGLMNLSAIVFDVSVQLAGLCMVIAGLARPSRWLERDAPEAQVSFVPAAPGAPVGASVVGRY